MISDLLSTWVDRLFHAFSFRGGWIVLVLAFAGAGYLFWNSVGYALDQWLPASLARAIFGTPDDLPVRDQEAALRRAQKELERQAHFGAIVRTGERIHKGELLAFPHTSERIH